jgi:hypothetical protein
MYQPALRHDQIKALYHLRVELRRPMTKLAREAIDCFLQKMELKGEQARQAGSTLGDWLAYEAEMEAGAAAKQTTSPRDANAPF